MTEKQRLFFANKLSYLPDMSSYSEGTETHEQFAIRIVEMLKNQQKFITLYPYLKKIGYLPSNDSD